MKKLLKIRFVEFDRVLVGQQIGIEGKEFFKVSDCVCFIGAGLDFSDSAVWISRNLAKHMNAIAMKYFDSNAERDEYLEKVIRWISEEQFRTKGKLEIGRECEVSNDGEEWERRIFAGKTAKQLGEPRTIALRFKDSIVLRCWKYVRPITSCVLPKIEGDVYTWEMEMGE